VRLLRVAIVAVVLIAAVTELGARFLVEAGIVSAVHRRDPGATDVAAQVSFPLLYGVLVHRSVSRVQVTAGQVNLGPVVADQVTATATGVHLSAFSLTRRVSVTSIDHIDLAASFTAAEASAALPPGFSFVFGQDTVTLQTPITSITGRFTITAPGRLTFTITGSPIGGLTLPSLAFSASPLPACLNAVTLQPGFATLACSEDRPPATFLPTLPG
jgi:hypothetical protein